MTRIVGDADSRGNPRVQTVNNDESETIQSDAHLADLKNIMGAFARDGVNALDLAEQTFADVSEFNDYAEALREVDRAKDMFLTLPSKVREIFGHNVAVFLDTAHDDDKREAMVKAGFIKAPEEVIVEPVVEPVVGPTE